MYDYTHVHLASNCSHTPAGHEYHKVSQCADNTDPVGIIILPKLQCREYDHDREGHMYWQGSGSCRQNIAIVSSFLIRKSKIQFWNWQCMFLYNCFLIAIYRENEPKSLPFHMVWYFVRNHMYTCIIYTCVYVHVHVHVHCTRTFSSSDENLTVVWPLPPPASITSASPDLLIWRWYIFSSMEPCRVQTPIFIGAGLQLPSLRQAAVLSLAETVNASHIHDSKHSMVCYKL